MTKDNEQLSFDTKVDQTDDEPVVCLGIEFKNDEERREYFRNELRKKLPELKKIEGFPIGEDEDIIALSDPPYYTACPNPWINDFIEEWEKEKVEKYGRDPEEDYHREPLASDVSEGKNNPIYLAHRYHTKVPHKAVMKYILHYTNPGDIVMDGFAGSGMTGVACMKSNIESEVQELMDEKQTITHFEYGKRNVILSDLSPLASFLSKSLNNINDHEKNRIKNGINLIIQELENELGWMYKTNHLKIDSEIPQKGNINYIVWSEVFICPSCSEEIIYFDATVDLEQQKVIRDIKCRGCGYVSQKRELRRSFVSEYDLALDKVVNKSKMKPVYINYTYGNKRFFKKPDKNDLLKIEKVKKYQKKYWYPINELIKGDELSRNKKNGFTHVHQMIPERSRIVLGALYEKIKIYNLHDIANIILTASIPNLTWGYSWRLNGKGGFISGTFYIPSTPQENNSINQIKRKLNDYIRPQNIFNDNKSIISTQSLTKLKNISDNKIDYIFTDPPFGANLMYSELNYIWESWLKVFTDNKDEAIINSEQEKVLHKYQRLLEMCFKEYYRILMPGRWITIAFSNSRASVWNAIQEAVQKSGFVIADVSALDKKQGSFKALTTTTAVKQDLVISAYKPEDEKVKLIMESKNTSESAWEFVTLHLNKLAVFQGKKGNAEIIAERTPRILFDRMVAFHVQNGLPVPISSAEFQEEIAQRFPMRDGMVFLENQVAEYDKKRILVKEFSQQSLFVSDENSAIEWIRQQLMNKPQTRQDIHPNFMKEIQHIARHEILPELDDLLNENFLQYEGDGEVPSQITTYLRRNYKDLRGLDADHPDVVEKAMNRWYVPDPRKQGDLERLRERALLREFEGYLAELEGNRRKLRQFRTEAIRAGFKKAYSDKDFKKIVEVGNRLPERIIQEDDKLLMYYDNACMLADM